MYAKRDDACRAQRLLGIGKTSRTGVERVVVCQRKRGEGFEPIHERRIGRQAEGTPAQPLRATLANERAFKVAHDHIATQQLSHGLKKPTRPMPAHGTLDTTSKHDVADGPEIDGGLAAEIGTLP